MAPLLSGIVWWVVCSRVVFTIGLASARRTNVANHPCGTVFQERKSSPKNKSWGRISRGRQRGYPGGRPGAKTSVRPSKSWKNKHFGADIHDPKARTSMTRGG